MWTRDAPTLDGFYWYQHDEDNEPQILELTDGVWWAIGSDCGVLADRMPGVWFDVPIIAPRRY